MYPIVPNVAPVWVNFLVVHLRNAKVEDFNDVLWS